MPLESILLFGSLAPTYSKPGYATGLDDGEFAAVLQLQHQLNISKIWSSLEFRTHKIKTSSHPHGIELRSCALRGRVSTAIVAIDGLESQETLNKENMKPENYQLVHYRC